MFCRKSQHEDRSWLPHANDLQWLDEHSRPRQSYNYLDISSYVGVVLIHIFAGCANETDGSKPGTRQDEQK